MLTEEQVKVFCNHGRHRSVGVAEMAEQEVQGMQWITINITKIHVDAGQCSQKQWQNLLHNRI